MPIKALENIRHSGRIFKAGDLIKGLNSDEEKRLINLKAAEKVLTDQDIEHTVTENEVDPVVFKELSEALDEAYGAEDLKREAKAKGVVFESNRKPDVIEAIIKQGKVDLFLEDEAGE